MAETAAGPDEPYLTVSEVARRWRVSPSTVYRWLDEGHFPHAINIAPSDEPRSRKPRIPLSDVLAAQRLWKESPP